MYNFGLFLLFGRNLNETWRVTVSSVVCCETFFLGSINAPPPTPAEITESLRYKCCRHFLVQYFLRSSDEF